MNSSVFDLVVNLMKQHIMRAVNTTAWDPCISIAEPELAKVLRHDGVQVGGGIKQVGHLDAVQVALGIALVAQ